MSAKLIGVIYLYLVSLISLFILVGGIFSSIKAGLNLTLYDKYPSRFSPADLCEFTPQSIARIPLNGSISTPSAEGMTKWKEDCEKRALVTRRGQMVEDITRSLVMLLVGGVLFAYHFPKAKKSSN